MRQWNSKMELQSALTARSLLGFLFAIQCFALLACDPNSKVVRARQDEPQDEKRERGNEGIAGNTGGATDSSASPRPSDLEIPDANDLPTSGSSGGGQGPSGSVSSGGSQSGSEPAATGRCDSGDWGACFREARAFIVSDPKKAIDLYLMACLPGESAGDGLACNAAAMLAKSSGHAAGAAQYFKAACEKEKYPVLGACRAF